MWVLVLSACDPVADVSVDIEPAEDTGDPWVPVDPLPEPSAALHASVASTVDVQMWALAAGDMDGDGHDDVLRMQDGDGQVHFGPLSDLAGAPTRRVPFHQGGYMWPTGVALDVDGDGDDDLLLGHMSHDTYAGRVSLLLAQDRSFEPVAEWTAGAGGDPHASAYFGWQVASAGDQDGDGLVDLLMSGSQVGAAAVVIPGTAAGGTAADAALLVIPGETWTGFDLAAGDVDGDGLSDVVVAGWPGVGVFLHGAQGTVPFEDADVFHEAASMACVTLLQSGETGNAELWLGEWAARQVRRLDQPMAGGASPAGVWVGQAGEFGRWPGQVGDVNGDGHPDLAYYGGDERTLILEPVEGTWDADTQALVTLTDTYRVVGVQADNERVLVGGDWDQLRLWTLEPGL